MVGTVVGSSGKYSNSYGEWMPSDLILHKKRCIRHNENFVT